MYKTLLEIQFRSTKSILNINVIKSFRRSFNKYTMSLPQRLYRHQQYYNTHAFKESISPHLKEFKVTDEAFIQLNVLKEKFPNKILRISVETGGCHGFQYNFVLEHVNNITEDDLLFKKSENSEFNVTEVINDSSIICDNVSWEILKSARLDYSRELIGSAFQIIDNPAAASGCGCGVSFDLKEK